MIKLSVNSVIVVPFMRYILCIV